VIAKAHRLLPALSAVAGVVLAHVVDYTVVFPHPAERGHQLLASGHGYWPAAVAVALVGGTLAVGLTIARGGRRGLLGRWAVPDDGPTAVRLARLAALQLGLFTAMELAEHAAAGLPPSELVHRPELVVGLAVQLVVAAGTLLALKGLEALAERVAARWRVTGAHERRPQLRPQRPRARPRPAPASASRPRGPPHPAPA
jgi:hypothetical protein